MKAIQSKGRDVIAFVSIFFLIVLFYWDLFFTKSASLMGDHLEQHYPWAFLLSQSIRHFEIPWWTNLIHCGFPIVAEGQIGAFYPINLLLAFLLPFKWAYSYANVVHFLLVGFGTYSYARLMKLDPLSSWVASVVFLFGAAYGGAYYNITSLKTIAWFPWGLFFLEKLWNRQTFVRFLSLSVCFAMSLLAGYLQIAVLMIGIVVIYGVLRILIPSRTEKVDFQMGMVKATCLLGSLFFATILVLPQLFLTFQLSQFSNRVGLTKDYAYVGSMSPLVFTTFLFSEMQGMLRGNSLYAGVLSVFFMFCAFFHNPTRKEPLFRLWVWMAIASTFLALGHWSPLYVGLIKLTHFYSFRVPAKFLVFICFSAAMLIGLGIRNLSAIFKSKERPTVLNWAFSCFAFLLSATILFHAVFYFFLTRGRQVAVQLGQWFVERWVYGRAGHPYSLEVYREKLEAALDSMKSILSLHNPWNIWMYATFVISCILIGLLVKFRNQRQIWLLGMLSFLCVDLYVFSWRDIKRDFDTYHYLDQPSKVVELLKAEQKRGELVRLLGFRNQEGTLPVVPSQNMLYGFSDIGAYSPLVLRRYYETIGFFGNINDSNRAFPADISFLKSHLPLLRALGGSHILSAHSLDLDDFEVLFEDPRASVFLYRDQLRSGYSFFVSEFEVFQDWEALKKRFLEPGFNPREAVLIEASELYKFTSTPYSETEKTELKPLEIRSGLEKWVVEPNQAGFFVLMNSDYPGWRATVNHRETPIVKAYGLFQAVYLPRAGRYEIEFRYQPFQY